MGQARTEFGTEGKKATKSLKGVFVAFFSSVCLAEFLAPIGRCEAGLKNQHGVAVAEEAIAVGDGLAVGLVDKVGSGQGADQDEQR